MIRDKSFYKTFLLLAGTLILEQVVVLSVNLVDNVMIGAYSEAALSGIAVLNKVQFVLQQFTVGISGGLIVLASQYWGQKRTKPIKNLTAIALRYDLIVGAVLFLAATIFPEQIMRIFVEDEAVIAEGMAYLNIVKFSYIPFVITAALLCAMRSVENVKLAFEVSLISLAINCLINYVLIYGRFGLPELGARGAAIGTLAARVIECVIVCLYVLKKDTRLGMKLKDVFSNNKALAADYARTAAPVIVQHGLWGFANALQTAILGHLAVSAMTAYDISSTIFLLLAVAASGAATGASILVGKQIGSGDRASMRKTVNTLQVLFLLTGLLMAGAMFLVRVPLLSAYDIAPETYKMASDFIIIKGIIMFTMSYQMPVNCGIIRGGGNTKYGMILDIISCWGIVLPLTYLAAFVWKWSPVAVIICLNSDQVFKCIPAAIYGNSLKWMRSLTREKV